MMDPKPSNINLSIVVFCHKHDFFLAKICIASIRYYYPNVPVYLVKDKINGDFNSAILEKFLNVKEIDLGQEKYGYTSAKLLFILSKKFKYRKFLILDADTVFVGNVLSRLQKYVDKFDFVVSAEKIFTPGKKAFSRFFYNAEWAKSKFPQLKYPGYVFNTGHIFVSPYKIKPNKVVPYFSKHSYPYWNEKYIKNFPTFDQSLLNIIIPILTDAGEISTKPILFSKWSDSRFVDKMLISKIKSGKYPYIVHWCASPKDVNVINMHRGDILKFFNEYYYSKIPLGILHSYFETARTLLLRKK